MVDDPNVVIGQIVDPTAIVEKIPGPLVGKTGWGVGGNAQPKPQSLCTDVGHGGRW